MADTSTGTSLREHVLFFSRFLKSPRMVGAITASSRALADAMVRDLELGGRTRIVELGPGTGALTSVIVERLGASTQFLAVDIDPEFARRIRERWPTVECVCASAEHLDALVVDRGMLPVDHIVSGLPFVSLPVPMTQQILQCVAGVLRRGGTFTTFQYVHAYGLPRAVAFRKSMTERMGGHPPAVRFVFKNVPPAIVLTWTKG